MRITNWVGKEHLDWCEELIKNINRDHEDEAVLVREKETFAVSVSKQYMDYVEAYVQLNCKVKK